MSSGIRDQSPELGLLGATVSSPRQLQGPGSEETGMKSSATKRAQFSSCFFLSSTFA